MDRSDTAMVKNDISVFINQWTYLRSDMFWTHAMFDQDQDRTADLAESNIKNRI